MMPPETVERASPAGPKVCVCVRVHRPRILRVDAHHVQPVSWRGPDTQANLVYVCSNCHVAAHLALDVLRAAGGPANVPWLTRRRFPRYAWALAVDGWTRWDQAGRP